MPGRKAHRFKRIIVVTSSYHMPRSLTELRRTMPGVELVPHPVISHRLHTQRWWTDAYTARVLFAEYVKFLPAAARYRIARLLRWESFALAGARAHGMFQPSVMIEKSAASRWARRGADFSI